MKQYVSVYSEAILRFTNDSYNRLITMRDMWRMLRSQLIIIKYTGEKSALRRVLKVW